MSELAAVDFDRQPLPTAIEIVDRLRDQAASISGHVDSVGGILGDDFARLLAHEELKRAVRQLAYQRYVSAREDRRRLLAMLNQAEDRLSTESEVFAVVERLTCS